MKPPVKILAALALAWFFLAPSPVSAQDAVREPVPHNHVISGNPLILLAGWFNAEYERKIAETMTVGISGGWLDLDDDDYTSVTGFLRYYPQEAAFTGFYLGGRGGVQDPHGLAPGGGGFTPAGARGAAGGGRLGGGRLRGLCAGRFPAGDLPG